MNSTRIPLDSELWRSTEPMQRAHARLQELLANSHPTPEMIQRYIETFDLADSVEREYYFTLPYLVDYLDEHFERTQASLPYFIHTLMTPDALPAEGETQIRGARAKIAALMLKALEAQSAGGSHHYSEDCLWFLAGIGAAYLESEIGRRIERLTEESS